MSNTITRTEAIRLLSSTQGRLFRVVFTRRSDGQKRVMICRTGVKKGVKGTGKPADPKHRLISVYDMQAEGFRSIPQEGIEEITFGGKFYIIKD